MGEAGASAMWRTGPKPSCRRASPGCRDEGDRFRGDRFRVDTRRLDISTFLTVTLLNADSWGETHGICRGGG